MVKRYEPERVAECLMMLSNEEGRYVLFTEFKRLMKAAEELNRRNIVLNGYIVRLEQAQMREFE